MAKTLGDALEQLRRDPGHPVRVQVEDLEVEIRRVEPSAPDSGRSAREAFREIGPWEGETQDEILRVLREGRLAASAPREPPEL